MCKCKRCGRKLKNQKSIQLGYGATCYRIVKLNQIDKPEKSEKFDMNEIKSFITLEIAEALKEFNFSRPINNDKTTEIGIVPIRINKPPKFNILETNKRMVVKELREQLSKGIENILQDIGSFDEDINFYEAPMMVEALV